MRTHWDRVCEKKFSNFFTCGRLSLLSTLHLIICVSVRTSKSVKMIFFESRSFGVKVLGGRSNVGNRLVGPQMTSQIASMTIFQLEPQCREISAIGLPLLRWEWISFHSGTWVTICGHFGYFRFCNYKVFQNYIYHNENLFRTTELYKECSIIFVFRLIFTNLQLLARNHISLPQKQVKK